MGHDLVTTVNYYLDPADGSPPTPVYVGGTSVTNTRPSIAITVIVTDISSLPAADQPTLDTYGFTYHTHATAVPTSTFTSDDLIRREYYPECEAVIRSVTSANSVKAFDHKLRCGPANWHNLGSKNTASRGPLRNAHVDQSYEGAEMRRREVLGLDLLTGTGTETSLGKREEEGEGDRRGRWGIVNIWRPLKPIHKDPLAVADARTVSDTDLVAASIIYAKTGRRNESWTVKPNPARHNWYYKYEQQPNEVLLIKCFDSDETVARRAPHCAVEDPAHAHGEWRESVEVRCMVFY